MKDSEKKVPPALRVLRGRRRRGGAAPLGPGRAGGAAPLRPGPGRAAAERLPRHDAAARGHGLRELERRPASLNFAGERYAVFYAMRDARASASEARARAKKIAKS